MAFYFYFQHKFTVFKLQIHTTLENLPTQIAVVYGKGRSKSLDSFRDTVKARSLAE